MTKTKGNVIVENIKVGDIHYEYAYGLGIKCEVISEPIARESHGDFIWIWKSKNLNSGNIIEYAVNNRYPFYGPELYDYEAYIGINYI